MSVDSHQSDTVVDEHTLESTEVITKYQTAALIANKALQVVMDNCKEAMDIFELCKLGDDTILEETGKVYNKSSKKKAASGDKEGNKKDGGDNKKEDKKEEIEKGIGFPTCISVNEMAGHFSPLKGESKALRSGDLVKIDLGVCIDGLIAQTAHTVVVPDESGNKITDRRADVIAAAYNCAEAAIRLAQPGKKNSDITHALSVISDEFKCTPVSGVLSHEVKRNCIDGEKVIIGKDGGEDHKVDEFVFETNKAYVMDIMLSTGDGKVREQECRHTVYKRAAERQYSLKTAKARQFISEINKKFPHYPFSLRNIEDEQCARIGVGEAKRHQLLTEYPVLAERPGEYIAQFKFTVLILPGGTKKITGLPLSDENMASTCCVENEDMKKLLAQSAAPRKKRANKNKNKAEAE